jgi:hypothetical protein
MKLFGSSAKPNVSADATLEVSVAATTKPQSHFIFISTPLIDPIEPPFQRQECKCLPGNSRACLDFMALLITDRSAAWHDSF